MSWSGGFRHATAAESRSSPAATTDRGERAGPVSTKAALRGGALAASLTIGMDESEQSTRRADDGHEWAGNAWGEAAQAENHG